MKHLYWRPQKVNRTAIGLVGVLAVFGLIAVEELRVERQSSRYVEKVQASRLASQAMQVIKAERLAKGHPVDPEIDPSQSGMIGVLSSPVTSTAGNLYAKQQSTNPNFAALMVTLLDQAGVQPGDVVAVGLSGSFPGLNVSTYAALSVLEAEPIVISSASASEWGANIIGFGWPDMEMLLVEKGVFKYRSVAGSLGGLEDRGVGMSRAGVSMLRSMLERNGIPIIETEGVDESVDERMRRYQEYAGGRRIKAYVNVGGGTASLGSRAGRNTFKPGLNLPSSFVAMDVDSAMGRFVQQGVPVIHVSQIETLATTYGIPPIEAGTPPAIGDGRMFVEVAYNAWLAFGVLVTILLCLYAAIRSDIGARLFQVKRQSQDGRPQPMV